MQQFGVECRVAAVRALLVQCHGDAVPALHQQLRVQRHRVQFAFVRLIDRSRSQRAVIDLAFRQIATPGFLAIHPHDRAVVHAQLQRQHAHGGRIVHLKLRAERPRDEHLAVRRFVRDFRLQFIVAEAERTTAGLPLAVVKAGNAPRLARGIIAFLPAPRGIFGQQRRRGHGPAEHRFGAGFPIRPGLAAHLFAHHSGLQSEGGGGLRLIHALRLAEHLRGLHAGGFETAPEAVPAFQFPVEQRRDFDRVRKRSRLFRRPGQGLGGAGLPRFVRSFLRFFVLQLFRRHLGDGHEKFRAFRGAVQMIERVDFPCHLIARQAIAARSARL